MKRMLFIVSILFTLHTSLSIALALPPGLIPRTGQTICYDAEGTVIPCAGTGQDGDTLTGITWPNPRFIDNSVASPEELTVTDNLTGLIWAKDGNLMATRDPSFDADGTAQDGRVTWQHALDYVKKLNTESYMGHNDWRLPNSNELQSMVSKKEANSADWLNTLGFANVRENGYWSSSTLVENSQFAWYIVMKDGYVYYSLKVYDFHYSVWPVRGGQDAPSGSVALPKTGQTVCYDEIGTTIDCSGTGQDGELQTGTAWPSPRFSDNSDQTMTDNLTGLIWTKDAYPAAILNNWQDALDYIKTINSSNYLGYSDWRLPNINELESMVNKGEANLAAWLEAQGFSNVRASYNWTSSNYTDNPIFARSVDIDNGHMDGFSKTSSGYLWPVRGGYSGTVVHLNISKGDVGTGTVTPDSGSIAWNGTSGTVSYLQNDTATLTAAPDSGSSFTGWTGCNSVDGNVCTVSMDAAKSVTATFGLIETLLPATWDFGEMAILSTPSVKSFTLNSGDLSPLVVSGITIIGSNPSQFSVTPGTCPSLTPTLAPATSCTLNVTFNPTILGPKSATLRITTTSINNPTLDAQLAGIVFIPYNTLTITSQGTGSGRIYYYGGSCTGNCSQSFSRMSSPLQLTPVADPGSHFSGWSGCDSVTGDICNVMMSAAKSITATFTLAPSLVEQWVSNGPVNGQTTALAVNPTLPATIFAGTSDVGLYRSNDGSSTWNPVNTGLTDTNISVLAINPLTPTTIYTDTANSGLFRSDDSGVNWSLVSSELKGAKALSINLATPTILYAGGCGGVCKSTDSGSSWNPVNSGLSDQNLSTLVSALAIHPTTPDTLYAGAMGGADLNGGLFKSTDGGDNWVRLNGGLTDDRLMALAINPLASDTLYAGTDVGGVFKTTDGGTTWSPVNTGLTNTSIRTLAINQITPSTIYAGTASGIFRSTDNGDNWSPLNTGLTNTDVMVLAIDPVVPSNVYVGTNGGGVFKLTLVTAEPVIALSPSSSDFGAVATYASSATEPFTISNSGTDDLIVTAATLVGANPGEFSLQPGNCPSLTPTLAPGASCAMEVTFVPRTVGSKSANLQVASNDADNLLKSAPLTGIAYDPPPIGMIVINSGANFTSTTSVNLALAAFDNSGTVAEMRFSNSNTSWSAWEQYGNSKEWTLTPLGGDGGKTVFVQFRDGVGNASGSFADSITLDTTPPVSTITSMPGSYYPSADGSITFSATESATFQCQMDSGPWGTCASPFSFSVLIDGSHTFSVKATDLAGNSEATAKSHTFTVDTTPPDTTITSKPALLTNSSSGMFSFSSPDPAAVFHCKLDSGSWSYCFSFGFNGLADGIHTFSVRAVDPAGNMDLTPATYTWKIDTVAPDTTLISYVNGSAATFTVESPDPTATFQCKLDNAAWSVCSGAVNFTNLANGSHTFSVRAIDPVGNIDPTPAIYSWSSPCNVQVVGGSCYATIGEALTAAPDNGAIHAKTMSFPEAVNLIYSKSLTFVGGYGPNFEPPAPGAMTTVNGFTLSNGAMAVENLVVR